MKIALILTLLLSIAPALIRAQGTHDMSQMGSQSDIDGSQHPEQITDELVYRLFFVAVSQAHEPKPNLEHRFTHLRGAGLSDSDVLLASQILDDFRSQYLSLLNEYNNDLGTQSGSTAALPLFKSKRDMLVSNTRDALIFGLSTLGRDSFLKRVQSEKRGVYVQSFIAPTQVINARSTDTPRVINASFRGGSAKTKIVPVQGCQQSQIMNGGSINSYTTQSSSGPQTINPSTQTLTQTTTADGYINYTPSEYCKVSGNPHYASIIQTVGTTMHSIQGVHVCPSCQFYAADTSIFVGVPGVVFADVVTAGANCAAGGWHFVKKFLDLETEWGKTYQRVTSPVVNGFVSVTEFCSNTTVPDFNPFTAGPFIIYAPTPVLFGLGFVARNKTLGIGWHQIGPAWVIDTNLSPLGPAQPCTFNP